MQTAKEMEADFQEMNDGIDDGKANLAAALDIAEEAEGLDLLPPMNSRAQWRLAKRMQRKVADRRCDCGQLIPFVPGKFECDACESVTVDLDS